MRSFYRRQVGRTVAVALWTAAALAGAAVEAVAQQAAAAAPATVSSEKALVNRYCVTCHNQRRKTPEGAPLMLDQVSVDDVGANPAVWEKVVRKLRSGAMPPAGMPRPEPGAFQALLTSIEGTLDKQAAAHPNPGRPAAVHRLNRT